MTWRFPAPHESPFRAATRFHRIDEKSAEGTFVASPLDALNESNEPLQLMVVEAMAQIGGGLVFTDDREPAFLSAIDAVRYEAPIETGDRVEIRVTLDASFGSVFRFSGVALVGETERVRARFYLSGKEQTSSLDA